MFPDCCTLFQVNKVRYHEMDLSLSLAQNLQGKRVIEYPILLVLLSTEVKEYPLMDTQLAAGNSQVYHTFELAQTDLLIYIVL